MIYQVKILHSYNDKYDIENTSLGSLYADLSISKIIDYFSSLEGQIRITDCTYDALALLIAEGLDCRKLSFWDDFELADKYSELLYLLNSVIIDRVSLVRTRYNDCIVLPKGDSDFFSKDSLAQLHPVLFDCLAFRYETVMQDSLFSAIITNCKHINTIANDIDAAVLVNKVLNSDIEDPGVMKVYNSYLKTGGFRDTKAYLLTLWSLAVNNIAYPLGNKRFILMCDYDKFDSIFKMYYKKYYDACLPEQNPQGFSPSKMNINYTFWSSFKDSIRGVFKVKPAETTSFFN